MRAYFRRAQSINFSFDFCSTNYECGFLFDFSMFDFVAFNKSSLYIRIFLFQLYLIVPMGVSKGYALASHYPVLWHSFTTNVHFNISFDSNPDIFIENLFRTPDKHWNQNSKDFSKVFLLVELPQTFSSCSNMCIQHYIQLVSCALLVVFWMLLAGILLLSLLNIVMFDKTQKTKTPSIGKVIQFI